MKLQAMQGESKSVSKEKNRIEWMNEWMNITVSLSMSVESDKKWDANDHARSFIFNSIKILYYQDWDRLFALFANPYF